MTLYIPVPITKLEVEKIVDKCMGYINKIAGYILETVAIGVLFAVVSTLSMMVGVIIMMMVGSSKPSSFFDAFSHPIPMWCEIICNVIVFGFLVKHTGWVALKYKEIPPKDNNLRIKL
jgi:hypothetical protein